MTDDKRAQSPSSRLMQAETTDWNPETETVQMRFVVPDSFISPRGAVQGGLIAGFLDEVMGAAVFVKTGGAQAPLNLDISMTLLRPVLAGTLFGTGRIIKWGRTMVFLEGELFDEVGKLLARSTSTAMITDI